MGQTGSPSTKKVEDEIPHRSEPVFYIIAENIERPHVAEKVKKAAVKEHERKKGCDLLPQGEVRGNFRDRVSCRHETIDIDELILERPLRYLNQVEKDVDGDEKDVDDGIVFGPIGVPDRYH